MAQHTNNVTPVTTTSINTSTNTSSFVEGQSTVRPPLFNGNNYAYWACRMKIYLQSIGPTLGMSHGLNILNPQLIFHNGLLSKRLLHKITLKL